MKMNWSVTYWIEPDEGEAFRESMCLITEETLIIQSLYEIKVGNTVINLGKIDSLELMEVEE